MISIILVVLFGRCIGIWVLHLCSHDCSFTYPIIWKARARNTALKNKLIVMLMAMGGSWRWNQNLDLIVWTRHKTKMYLEFLQKELSNSRFGLSLWYIIIDWIWIWLLFQSPKIIRLLSLSFYRLCWQEIGSRPGNPKWPRATHYWFPEDMAKIMFLQGCQLWPLDIHINISILMSISIKNKGLVHAMRSNGPLHQVIRIWECWCCLLRCPMLTCSLLLISWNTISPWQRPNKDPVNSECTCTLILFNSHFE